MQLKVKLVIEKVATAENFKMAPKGAMFNSENSYKGTLLQVMYNFSKSEYCTDVALFFSERKMHAHKVVLAACSSVFAAMFETDMKEKFEASVDLSYFGLRDSTAEDLMEYIYTGKLNLSVLNVEQFLACSNFLMMDKLREACCNFLEKLLEPSNCLGIASIASKFDCISLNEKATKMVYQEFVEVVEGEEFLHLTHDDIASLFSNDSLEIPHEDFVMNCLIKWLNFDIQRMKHFKKLVRCIRVNFLSEKYVSILKSMFCNSHIENGIQYRQLFFKGKDTLCHKSPRHCLDITISLVTTGGYDGSNCLMSSFAFSPADDGKWGYLSPMQFSRHDHGTAVLQNQLVVVGGFNSNKGPLDNVEVFNPVRNEWSCMASMNAKRKSLGVCVYNDILFVSGGLDGNYNALDTVEYYDREKKSWSVFYTMNHGRYSHGFVATKNSIFAIGGWKEATVEEFTEGQWRMIPSLPVPRAGATCTVHKNKIYVIGGYSESHCVSSVEIYDIELGTWISGVPSQICRWRAGSALMNDKMYVLGGRNSSWQYLDSVESYSFDDNRWQLEEPLPYKIMGLKCSVLTVPKSIFK